MGKAIVIDDDEFEELKEDAWREELKSIITKKSDDEKENVAQIVKKIGEHTDEVRSVISTLKDIKISAPSVSVPAPVVNINNDEVYKSISKIGLGLKSLEETTGMLNNSLNKLININESDREFIVRYGSNGRVDSIIVKVK